MTKGKKTSKDDAPSFDWITALNDLECPNMFKAGLKYYITSNNLDKKIKSEADFQKIVKQYSKVRM